MVIFVICLLVLLSLGIAMLVKPYRVWESSQRWVSEGGEPTDLALIGLRVGGVALVLFVLIMTGVVLFY